MASSLLPENSGPFFIPAGGRWAPLFTVVWGRAGPQYDDSKSFLFLSTSAQGARRLDVLYWGKHFNFVDSLPTRPVMGAFTATATERVRQDIIRLLRLQNPETVTTGFDRPNLYFEVIRPKNRDAALMDILHRKRGESGIVYCATRKAVEQVCDKLIRAGIDATRYHAGLSDEERKENQEKFQYDTCPVMVATTAIPH